jgi:hypothetical protein
MTPRIAPGGCKHACHLNLEGQPPVQNSQAGCSVDGGHTLAAARVSRDDALRPTLGSRSVSGPRTALEAAFIGHGAGGTGETTTIVLRPGNAGPNTAADHIAVVKRALGQPPPQVRAPC